MSTLGYKFSKKLKLLENYKFNHLTIILTLSLTCEPKDGWRSTTSFEELFLNLVFSSRDLFNYGRI